MDARAYSAVSGVVVKELVFLRLVFGLYSSVEHARHRGAIVKIRPRVAESPAFTVWEPCHRTTRIRCEESLWRVSPFETTAIARFARERL